MFLDILYLRMSFFMRIHTQIDTNTTDTPTTDNYFMRIKNRFTCPRNYSVPLKYFRSMVSQKK